MTTIKTFSIKNNTRSIEGAIAQCSAALADLGCSCSIKHNKKTIRVTAD